MIKAGTPEENLEKIESGAAGSEQRQILELLAAGQINAAEADGLLNALAASSPHTSQSAPQSSTAQRAIQMLRITVQTEDSVKVRVNVPLPLAKFAVQFLPKDARKELELQGIDLGGLIDSLEGGFPEGRLVDVEAYSEERDEEVTIIIEVV